MRGISPLKFLKNMKKEKNSMKKALSLVLAVLMIAGCMSLVVFAEEPTYNLIDIFEENGGTTIKLDTPIATPPVQDGVINDGEYNYVNRITEDPDTYSPISEMEGILKYYSEEGFLTGTDVIEEHFAYDDDYIYYAAELKSNDFVFSAAKLYVPFMAIPSELTTVEIGNIGLSGNREGLSTWGWYGYSGGQSKILAVPTDVKNALKADFPDLDTEATLILNDASTEAEGEIFNLLQGTVGVGKGGKLYELKFSRKYNVSDINTYGFAPFFYPDGAASRLRLMNVLNEDMQAAIGTTETRTLRFITVDYKYDDAEEALAGKGYSIAADGYVATAPVVDGNVTADEYTAYSGQKLAASGLWDSWYATNGGATDSFGYYVAHDADNVYVAFQHENAGTDARVSLAIGAGLAANYKANDRILLAAGKQDGLDGPDLTVPYFKALNGTETTDIANYFEYATTATTGKYTEWKISKATLKAELGVDTLDEINIAFYLAKYEDRANAYIAAPASALPVADGVLDAAVTALGMPVYLNYVEQTPPAGGDDNNQTPNNTTAATTTEAPATEAPTTAAPTTAAPTTAAPEKDGCGSSISLAALAIVPVLACGAAFVGKKKED